MTFVEIQEIKHMSQILESKLGYLGFEFYPFKVSWYNSLVQPIFKLSYNEDTVAFLIISKPQMFENAFIPFLKFNENEDLKLKIKDPIDECMLFYFSKIPQMFPGRKINIIHDFELHPNRRPKLIMQSIAHACGAAYFYHSKDAAVKDSNKKMFGVCIHPKYGGWFALRAVAFFEDIYCPSLPMTLPYDVVPSLKDRAKLLELYNFHWQDGRYRDIIPVKERYSNLQVEYFSTPPGKRDTIIEKLRNLKTLSET